MNELITLSLVEKNPEYLIKFPTNFFSPFDSSIVDWVLEFYATKSRLPSVSRLKKEHSVFIPIRSDEGLLLEDVFELTVKNKRTSYVSRKLTEAEEFMMDTGGEYPEAIIEEISLAQNTEELFVDYVSFDRKRKYVRKQRLDLGIAVLNRAMKGLSDGDFALIAGRLGTGKSMISKFLVYNWWLAGKNICYVSNEMLHTDIFMRMDGIVCGIDPLKFRSSDTPGYDKMIDEVSSTIAIKRADGAGSIIVPKQRGLSPAGLASLVRYIKNIDVLVVDGVYLMNVPGARGGPNWERVAYISRALKQMALALEIPVLGLTQLKRLGGKKEVDPEDLAYSDALGQDADFIIALRKLATDASRLEAMLIKNRFGPEVGTTLAIDWDHMRLIDEAVTPSESTRKVPAGMKW